MTKVRITTPISPIEFEPQSKFVIKPPIERRDACTPRISEFNVIGVLEICHIRRSGGGSINHRTTVQPTRHFPGGGPSADSKMGCLTQIASASDAHMGYLNICNPNAPNTEAQAHIQRSRADASGLITLTGLRKRNQLKIELGSAL